MDPFCVLASFGTQEPHHQMAMVTSSPLVPALKAVLRGFPFGMAWEVNSGLPIRFKGEIGLSLKILGPRLVHGIYEAFYRGLLGE